MIARRAYNRVATMLYTFINQHRLADKNVKRALHQYTRSSGTYFYVIVVPNVLHFLIPSVRLVQHHAKLIFVLNGIAPFEEHALRKEFPDVPTLSPLILPKTSWPHGHLLSLLLRNSNRDFGILDHDLFLFDPSAFNQLRFAETEFAICATSWKNSRSGLLFPGTHFLYFRTELLRGIMQRYGVDARLYKNVPREVQSIVNKMGFSSDNPPKEYQSFFDSFLLLSTLAMHDGFKVRTLNIPSSDLAHIGGTSIGLPITKDPFHHYTSARFLEVLSDETISKMYQRKGLVTSEKGERLHSVVDRKTAVDIDLLINRIVSTV